MLYINMVYTYYMVCVTCVLIEQLMPARPPKKLKRRHTSPNGDKLPLVVLKGCFAAKNSLFREVLTLETGLPKKLSQILSMDAGGSHISQNEFLINFK